MNKLRYLLIGVAIVLFAISCSDSDNDDIGVDPINYPLVPSKEIRGVWMATAWELDFPMKKYNEADQKALYKQYLDVLESHNMNAIFFQVRPWQGVLYESQYESWNEVATGTFAQAPTWDMIDYFIKEAHKRGIQFHAWFNPYRIATRAKATDVYKALDSKINPDLVKDFELVRMYNPALPEVQTHIGKIIEEFLTKYKDVDGIHIDDYFYPADGALKDDEDYAEYGEEGMGVDDFRRSNVDKAVLSMREAVLKVKPEALFSISPAGNNSYNLNTMYADIVKWSENGWADMIIPQLYYSMGNADTNFNHSLHWWHQYTFNNILAVGYGIHNFKADATNDKFKTNDDLAAQFAYAKSRSKVSGSVLYSASSMLSNPVDILAVIKDAYAEPTFTPYISRLNAIQPAAPAGVKASTSAISWDAVSGAEKYVVYKSNGNNKQATTIAITTSTSHTISEKGEYFVTAVGKHNIESEISKLVVN